MEVQLHSRAVYVCISSYSICDTVQCQLSEHQSSKPSITQTTNGKEISYRVLSNYWLLYRNITKPVKALQEFINKWWFLATVWTVPQLILAKVSITGKQFLSLVFIAKLDILLVTISKTVPLHRTVAWRKH